ncbi:hypothetical protein BV20DRAFT_971455 [Pilatotrama ljubarskyi]|nr:hypothetical protein BV20DRAFT_971455 [Pilatotrama ljubarskyi]
MALTSQREGVQFLATIFAIILLVCFLPIPFSSTAEAAFACADPFSWAHRPAVCTSAVSGLVSWYTSSTPPANLSVTCAHLLPSLRQAPTWLLAVAFPTGLVWAARYIIWNGLAFLITGAISVLWCYRNAIRVLAREVIDIKFIFMCCAFELLGMVFAAMASFILHGLEPIDTWILVPCAMYVLESSICVTIKRPASMLFSPAYLWAQRLRRPAPKDYISHTRRVCRNLSCGIRRMIAFLKREPGTVPPIVILHGPFALLPFLFLDEPCIRGSAGVDKSAPSSAGVSRETSSSTEDTPSGCVDSEYPTTVCCIYTRSVPQLPTTLWTPSSFVPQPIFTETCDLSSLFAVRVTGIDDSVDVGTAQTTATFDVPVYHNCDVPAVKTARDAPFSSSAGAAGEDALLCAEEQEEQMTQDPDVTLINPDDLDGSESASESFESDTSLDFDTSDAAAVEKGNSLSSFDCVSYADKEMEAIIQRMALLDLGDDRTQRSCARTVGPTAEPEEQRDEPVASPPNSLGYPLAEFKLTRLLVHRIAPASVPRNEDQICQETSDDAKFSVTATDSPRKALLIPTAPELITACVYLQAEPTSHGEARGRRHGKPV